MTFFNFGWSCPAHMTVTSPAKIVLAEHQCILPKDHPGPHKSKDGTIWMNSERTTDGIDKNRVA